MWPSHGLGGFVLIYGLLWIAVVVVVLMSLWRGMRALERIATSVAQLTERQERP